MATHVSTLLFNSEGKALTWEYLLLTHKRKEVSASIDDILEFICERCDDHVIGGAESMAKAEAQVRKWLLDQCRQLINSVPAQERDVPTLAIPVNRAYFDVFQWPATMQEAVDYFPKGRQPTYGVHFVYTKTDMLMLAYLNKQVVWVNGCVTRVKTMHNKLVDAKLLPANSVLAKQLARTPMLKQLS